jgi:ABC-type branched-subunit amino acid transport system ATPase component
MERGRIVHQGPSRALATDPAMVDHYLGAVG